MTDFYHTQDVIRMEAEHKKELAITLKELEKRIFDLEEKERERARDEHERQYGFDE